MISTWPGPGQFSGTPRSNQIDFVLDRDSPGEGIVPASFLSIRVTSELASGLLDFTFDARSTASPT